MKTNKNTSGTSVHVDRETQLRLISWYNRTHRTSEDVPPQSAGFIARLAIKQFLSREERENDIRFIAGVSDEK